MLTELAIIGSLAGALAGIVGLSAIRREAPHRELSRAAAIRAAMRGPDAASARWEFRRAGVVRPEEHPASRHIDGFLVR